MCVFRVSSHATPSTKNEADEHDDESELHMPIRSFAPRRLDESAFGDPKSRERTFVDLFVEDFVANEKAVHGAVVDLPQACARISDISVAPTSLTFAEVQKLAGNRHQPLQHEAAHEDSSSTLGE